MVNTNIRRKDGHPFYAELQSFDDFEAVSDLTRYTPAPDDWLVVIADIKGSTQAISEGRYKDVNMVGAACITAVLNVTRNHEIPYVFGGDGATLMVPPDTLPRVRRLVEDAEPGPIGVRIDAPGRRGTGQPGAPRSHRRPGGQILSQPRQLSGDVRRWRCRAGR